jgi:hypothetical protein
MVLATRRVSSAYVVSGTVRDDTGGTLPGVSVDAHGSAGPVESTVIDSEGAYRLDLAPGNYDLTFSLLNFGSSRRTLVLHAAMVLDVVLHFALSADVTVTRRGIFTNLADASNPAENLVGIAQSSSQGAMSAVMNVFSNRCGPNTSTTGSQVGATT